MLLGSGVDDIYALPQFLGKLGIDQVIVSTLDFVPSPELQKEALIPENKEEYKKLRDKLETVKKECENYGIEFHYSIPFPSEPNPLCTENVFSSLVVASDGEVSPCVFTGMPVSGATYIAMGREHHFQRLTFGNIDQENVSDIWKKKDYKHFRESFYTKELYYQCQKCPKLYIR